MKKFTTLFIIATILFTLVSGITGTKIAYAGNGLTSKQATQILQKINPHIISYNVDTHEVKYDDGTSVFVTPPNGKTRNGEVTWKYFLEQKGDLRGWLKYSIKDMLTLKRNIINKLYGKNESTKFSALSSSFPDWGYVSITQFPQERCVWCGVAATESALTAFNKNYSQLTIANYEYAYQHENVPPKYITVKDKNGKPKTVCYCSAPGAGIDPILYALNGLITGHFTVDYLYRMSHFKTINEFMNIVGYDIGVYNQPVICCGYTEHLPAWNGHHTVHYTTIYSYIQGNSSTYSDTSIAYTDSANGLYKYCHIYISGDNKVKYGDIPAYSHCYLNEGYYSSYYKYAYPNPAIG